MKSLGNFLLTSNRIGSDPKKTAVCLLLNAVCICFLGRFTSSPGENAFQVKITAPDEQFTRVGVQVLDRKDGSFIVRYRMYASYKNIRIEVKTKDNHVAKSPYILKGKEKD